MVELETAIAGGKPKNRAMIAPGTILVEASTMLPPCLLWERGTPGGKCWAPVLRTQGFPEFEAELRAGGWSFLYFAITITAIGIGLDRDRAAQAALRGLIATAEAQRCNSFEVSGVSERSFLGLTYLRVTAHPRHIQKGIAFTSLSTTSEHAGVGPA